MAPSRAPLSLLLAVPLVVLAACTGPAMNRRMGPPPTVASANFSMGYDEVVQHGEDYAEQAGYDVLGVREAQEIRPNYWRVRFGLNPEGTLVLEFDETQQRVVKATEEGGVAGKVVPGPVPAP